MSRPLLDRIPFAKIVAVLASGFVVGLGLCGLDYFLAAHGIGKSTEEFGVGPIDLLSLAVMFLSLSGLVISLVAWALLGILRSGGDIQTLFDNSDVSNFDDRNTDPEIQKPPGHKDA